MSFIFRPLGWRAAWAVAGWHYPNEYALYDLGLLPLLGSAMLHHLLVRIGGGGFYAVATEDDPLVGIFSFLNRGEALEIGLGLRPDLTGRGLGLALVRAGLVYGQQTFAPRAFTLTVATFNRRATTVYERAGFVPGKRMTKWVRGRSYEFMEMHRSAML